MAKKREKHGGRKETPGYVEREEDRKKKASKRAESRDIAALIDEVMTSRNLRRRGRCKNYPERFLRTYFPHVFYNPFTPNQKVIIGSIVDRIRNGGCQAIAAERSGGKSAITKGLLLWGVLYGLVRWVVVVESEATKAYDTIDDIVLYLDSPNANDPIAIDFPESVLPIRLLEGQGMRGKTQTYKGTRTRVALIKGRIIFPTIPGSLSSGAIIQGCGSDQSMRGLVRLQKRPDLVLLNDVETDETARSVTMTATIKKNVEKGLMGLAGPDKGISMLLLGSIIERNCLCDIYTDRKKNPAWNGLRLQLVNQWPERQDLWDRYMTVLETLTDDGIDPMLAAREFYAQHRKEMDAGAVVNNPYRFDKRVELSPIQHVHNLIAKMGRENFMAECQADPTDEAITTLGVDAVSIRSKLNGMERRVCMPGAERVTAFVDVHDARLFWAVCAWQAGFVGRVVDYGVQAVKGPIKGTLATEEQRHQTEIAVGEALLELRSQLESGEVTGGRTIDRVMIDAGYLPAVVYRFCASAAGERYIPSTGASSRGGGYLSPKHGAIQTRNGGHGFHQSWQEQPRIWLSHIDANLFKRRVQDGFLTPGIDQPGAMSLFGTDPVEHRAISEHICAEVWNAEKKKYEVVRKENHWLDCLAGCYAAAAMLGIRLQPTGAVKPRVKVSDLQKAKQNARISHRT